MRKKILLVDDELGICRSVSELLESSGYDCVFTVRPQETLHILQQYTIDILIIDVKMPEIDGINLLKLVKKDFEYLPVIMITGFPSVESAVTAMKYGALNYFTKPIVIEELVNEINTILLSKVDRQKPIQKNKFGLSSKNQEMQEIINIINQVAPTRASVFINGESGTGKELIANYLHYNSDRKNEPFIKVNCAAIPEALLESELFGHEKGAFTDAKTVHKGKFEMADGGTIFLDEIGDMDIRIQAKMLRVLQEQEFQRVGGHKLYKTDIRFIAATNKDIKNLIEKGEFRDDLYYRLSVIDIKLPRLEDRIEDIPDLVDLFINGFNKTYNKNVTAVSPEVKNILLNHSWPGNIRELKNCIERSIIFSNNDIIELNHLPKQYISENTNYHKKNTNAGLVGDEKKAIISALQKSKWKKQQAADMLNIHRKTLYNKMKKLGIE